MRHTNMDPGTSSQQPDFILEAFQKVSGSFVLLFLSLKLAQF
jgi:hypothetical protein